MGRKKLKGCSACRKFIPVDKFQTLRNGELSPMCKPCRGALISAGRAKAKQQRAGVRAPVESRAVTKVAGVSYAVTGDTPITKSSRHWRVLQNFHASMRNEVDLLKAAGVNLDAVRVGPDRIIEVSFSLVKK